MPESLSIRKTLVVGLGTTGKEVAEHLAEHLTWQFGDYQRAKWTRLLVLETEQPNSFLGDRVLKAGISREEYAPYLNAPRTTGAEFDFYEWQDGASLSAIPDPATGAGNLRMLGRLCLFHPATYRQLQKRVTNDISDLKNLTSQQIADALGKPDLNVTIHTNIVVYVVGTLCGGTCSGGAADLGYLIDEWCGSSVNRQAIFTLPHPGLTRAEGPRFKKNAYYALKELNHYQLATTRWLQKLPGNDRQSQNIGLPYDILRVVMPGGPSGEDVTRLNTMIGQYLAAAVGPAGLEIAANDVNALGKMQSTESVGFMRPLFSTMGIAALEYPGEHIQRAATCRLLAGTYSHWCRHSLDSEMFANAFSLLGGTDFEALLSRLTEGADRVSVAVFQEMFRPEKEGAPPRVEQVRQLLREVDGRLEPIDLGREGVDAALPTLLQVMQSNEETFLKNIEQDVQRIVDKSLYELDGGPGFVAEVLKRYLANMEQWATDARERLPENRIDSQQMRKILDDHIDALERVQNSHNPFGKAEKLRDGWRLVTDSVQSYLQTEIKTQALDFLQRRGLIEKMIEQYRRVTALLLRRLEQMHAAFNQEAAEMEKQWKQMAASTPEVNGRVYFDAEPPAVRGTVTEDYFNLLRQKRWSGEPVTGWDDSKKEEQAQRDILPALEPLRAELTRDDGTGAFDARPGGKSARENIPPAVLLAAEERARAFFAPLREQMHIADRATDADTDAVIQLSRPQLGVSASQICPQLADMRGIRPAEQEIAFMDMQGDRPSAKRIEEKLRNQLHLARGHITDSHDPFRLLLIREKHGFTFGQMEGVISASPYDLSALQSAENCTDFHRWHTRMDVKWTDPLVPARRVEETEEWWLMTVMLGRPADNMLDWTPANNKEIEPEGWYQVANAQFRVFYPKGIPQISDQETFLPLTFSEAVANLLTQDHATLRETLNMRLHAYRHERGDERLIRVVDKALASVHILSLNGLDRRQADAIVRRAYRREPSLKRAFFDFKAADIAQGRAAFAHLWHLENTPLPDGSENLYTVSAYYCPTCHALLGREPEDLHQAMFVCSACREEYWP